MIIAVDHTTSDHVSMKESENLVGTTVEMPDGPWSITDVARYLRTGIPTIRNDMKLRGLPYSKIGKRLYFNRADIDAWLAAQRAA